MKKMKVTNTLTEGLEKFAMQEKIENEKAAKAVAVQLLNFCAVGSPAEPVMPPIETGYLRGSGSVFVNNTFVSATPKVEGKGDPLRSLSFLFDKSHTVISIVYNTPYAARWHETYGWTAGGVKPSIAKQNNPNITKNVGNKWIEKHLNADSKDLMYLYAKRIKRGLFRE
jgi:hypothetical protein